MAITDAILTLNESSIVRLAGREDIQAHTAVDTTVLTWNLVVNRNVIFYPHLLFLIQIFKFIEPKANVLDFFYYTLSREKLLFVGSFLAVHWVGTF